jgi:hypothetical protein
MFFHPFVCGSSLEDDSNLSVETIGVLATSNNIFALMFDACLDFGGLGLEELGAKFVSMGYDGTSIF